MTKVCFLCLGNKFPIATCWFFKFPEFFYDSTVGEMPFPLRGYQHLISSHCDSQFFTVKAERLMH